ncbi:MAG: hypothetical protein DMG41_07850 [Acidobacteria bacterium]|nr:MAG: hypothetical protein AUH13_07190 [Acidobacteria bacterium 13_2_20CM_58_27]PYT89770.1 MAG: hypothetical protein DMG41_07850 [Acidobacteriota bacterium]
MFVGAASVGRYTLSVITDPKLLSSLVHSFLRVFPGIERGVQFRATTATVIGRVEPPLDRNILRGSRWIIEQISAQKAGNRTLFRAEERIAQHE